jgi:hypothetical protein
MQSRAGLAELAQRPREYPRSEVGSADADVDDIGDSLAAGTSEGAPLRIADKMPHELDGAADRGHDVAALRELRVPGAQRRVEHGASFGIVDGVSREHARDPPGHLRLSGQCDEQPHRLCVDAMLGIVEQESTGFEKEALGTRGICGEQLRETRSRDLFLVLGQRLPRGRSDELAHCCL